MKKLILSAAAFTMLFASCVKDDSAINGGKVSVNFNVAAEQIASRVVYGEGDTANDLEYAIYEKGSYTQPLIQRNVDNAFAGSAKSTTFTEQLVKGKTYIALFWADAKEDPYTINWNNQTVKITNPEALKSQDENLDAFFACHEIFVGQEEQNEEVELNRPFAQLNIGTADTEASRIAGLVVTNTEVSVRAYTTLNLLNGEVADAMQLTYASNAIPTGENATFTINEKTYDHLSMNYLLVNKKELIDVTFTVNDGTKDINTSSFMKVPVERNYKTFIIGNLLTNATNFEVVIMDGWKTPDYTWPGEDNDDDNEGEGGDNTGGNEGEGGEGGEGGDDNTGDDQPTIIDWDYVTGAYQIEKWENPWWHTDVASRYNPYQLGHGYWCNYVKLATDCIENGQQSKPKDGQRYGMVYSWNNHAYFNISQEEIDPQTWTPKTGTGCYALTDLIDRNTNVDNVNDNKSYYNKNEEAFYFSFTLTSGGTLYRLHGKMHSRGSVDIKEL